MQNKISHPRLFPRVLLTVFFLTMVIAPSLLAEDLTIVSQVKPPKGAPTTSTQYITPAKVRTSDGQADTIVDLESGKIIFIEHKKKKYYETTFEEIRGHFAQLEEMLQANPMLGQLFGGATQVDVQATGESREIAGHTCKQYILSFGPKFSFEVWSAPGLKPPLEYYDARKLLYANIGPFASRFEAMFEEMKKIEGFALATTVDMRVMGMNMHSETIATEVRKEPISDDVFAPPAGYKKKKSPYQK